MFSIYLVENIEQKEMSDFQQYNSKNEEIILYKQISFFREDKIMKLTTAQLEETPFRDLRYKQSSFRGSIYHKHNQRLTPEQNIQWKVISPSRKFDFETVEIPNKEDNQFLDRVIAQFKKSESLEFNMFTKGGLSLQIKEKAKMIKQWADKNYLKAVFVCEISCQENGLKEHFAQSEWRQKFLKLRAFTSFPLYCAYLGNLLCLQGKQIKKGEELLKEAELYGEGLAFLYYGRHLMRKGRLMEAFQRFKNAEINYIRKSLKLLSEIFMMGNNIEFPKNLAASRKYLFLLKSHPQFEGSLVSLELKLEDQLRVNSKIAQKIISTKQTECLVATNFMKNKISQAERGQPHPRQVKYSMTNNFTGNNLHGYCFVKKIFYVVFSPFMGAPSRCFLAEDENGSIEVINIYRWDEIDPSKLCLLHKLGTKVVLNEYIRKYGSMDQLPCYRIQNPYSVEIYQGSEKRRISDQKFREFGRTLFNMGQYARCMIIYEHLVRRNSDDLHIVYSNIGLIHQKQNNIKLAIEFYEKSLKIQKKYQKSQLRLCYIYLGQEKLKECEQIANDLQSEQKRKQILDKIAEIRKKQKVVDEQQFSKLNLKNVNFLKKGVKIEKQIHHYPFPEIEDKIDLAGNGPLKGDIQKYLNYYKAEISNILKISILSATYLEDVQKVYDYAQLPISNEYLQQFTKFFDFGYSQIYKNSKGKFFEQSSEYFILYFSKIYEIKDLMKVNLGEQLASSLSRRCSSLQRRIEDHCIYLEQKGLYKEAIQLYSCTRNYCLPFNRKISELLFKQSKIDENIEYCSKMLNILSILVKTEGKKVFKSQLYFVNQKIKCLIGKKKFEQAAFQGKQFLNFIKKENPKGISVQAKMTSLHQLFSSSSNFMAQEKCDSLIWTLKNNIAVSLMAQRKFNEALQMVDEQFMKLYEEEQKQLYFSTLLLKIKIISFIDRSKKNILDLVQDAISRTAQLKDKYTETYYKSAFLKFFMQYQIEIQRISGILDYATLINRISGRFGKYVIDTVGEFCLKNPQKAIQTILEANKRKQLAVIAQGLIQKCKHNFLYKLQKKQVVNQKILEFFQLLQYVEAEEEEIVQKLSEGEFYLEEEYLYQYQHYKKQEYIQQKEVYEDAFDREKYYSSLFEGFEFICQIKSDFVGYAVYFSEKMKLDKRQREQFEISAHKICRSEKGSNGIKIRDNEARLKINAGTRMSGEILLGDNIRFVLFSKVEGHDDYKRKK